MLAILNAGQTGLAPGYTILNADKTVYQARTATGVTELVAGSGSYGVVVADALAGKEIVWDTGVGEIGGAELLSPFALDQLTSGHTTTGTVGAALIAASAAGDPWGTALPGSYTAGQAGYLFNTMYAHAILISLGQIVEVSHDLTQNGSYFERYRGDDWNAATGKILKFDFVALAQPDLTGATVTFTARDNREEEATYDALLFTTAAVVVVGSATLAQQVTVAATHEQTEILCVGHRAVKYDLRAVLIDGSETELVTGEATIGENQTR